MYTQFCSNFFISDKRLKTIKTEIEHDRQMQTLQNVILKGWPETRSDCDQLILEYWNHRDELSFEKGLRTYATKYFTSHIEIFSILCIQFVLCMGYPFMK